MYQKLSKPMYFFGIVLFVLPFVMMSFSMRMVIKPSVLLISSLVVIAVFALFYSYFYKKFIALLEEVFHVDFKKEITLLIYLYCISAAVSIVLVLSAKIEMLSMIISFLLIAIMIAHGVFYILFSLKLKKALYDVRLLRSFSNIILAIGILQVTVIFAMLSTVALGISFLYLSVIFKKNFELVEK